MVNFSKFCSKRFHHLTDQRCCVEMSSNFFPTENQRNRALYTKPKKTKFLLLWTLN